jgi:predicted HicB family RNase H-like nuclease
MNEVRPPSSQLKYKGYTGTVTLDVEAGILFGRVDNIRDVVTFQGTSVPEVLQAFRDSVDDYLAFCAETGHPPEKPAPGTLRLSVSPAQHGTIRMAAYLTGKSVNAWAREVLGAAAREVLAEHGELERFPDD